MNEPIKSFDSLEDMFEHMRKVRVWNDLMIQDWQRALQPGDCYVRLYETFGSVITIYGEVIPPHPEDGPIDPSYRLVRAYSVACPEGEMGCDHISLFTAPLPRHIFERARDAGWPDLMQR